MNLTHFAEEKHPDWEIVYKASDSGISGDNSQRNALLTLLDHIESDKIDVVLAANPSRFYRDVNLAHDTMNRIKSHGAEAVFLDESEKMAYAPPTIRKGDAECQNMQSDFSMSSLSMT